jgi:signal transduction histidine kinase
VNDAPSDLASLHEFIRRLPLFADLTLDDVSALCRSSSRMTYEPGATIVDEGAAGDSLYVILSGEVEVTKKDGDGGEIVLAVRGAGEVLGEMSLLQQSPRTATIRAVRRTEAMEIGPLAFRSLLEGSPGTAATILRTMASRLRSTEASLVQREKLASLGTLAAGLAHELNNPAAAIQRSAAYLSMAFDTWRRRSVELQVLTLNPDERRKLEELERSIIQCGEARPTTLESGREEETLIEDLESKGVAEPWEMAPALVAYGWTAGRLAPLADIFAAGNLAPVLQWFGAGLAAQQLIEEIRKSGEQISQIVRSVKSYTYLDQAPVQDVNVHTSLEDTLMILHHKIKQGVEVVRDFAPDLPTIEAFGGELNQIWTNLVDNAVQAMDGKGRLEIRARRVGDEVEVRIADSGPGIPADVGQKIFEPFYTTKAQGIGTGLGLHIVHNIVVNRHRGRIDFESQPGRTEFKIVLPIRLKRAPTEGAPKSA